MELTLLVLLQKTVILTTSRFFNRTWTGSCPQLYDLLMPDIWAICYFGTSLEQGISPTHWSRTNFQKKQLTATCTFGLCQEVKLTLKRAAFIWHHDLNICFMVQLHPHFPFKDSLNREKDLHLHLLGGTHTAFPLHLFRSLSLHRRWHPAE